MDHVGIRMDYRCQAAAEGWEEKNNKCGIHHSAGVYLVGCPPQWPNSDSGRDYRGTRTREAASSDPGSSQRERFFGEW